jgi:hypothetical protein
MWTQRENNVLSEFMLGASETCGIEKISRSVFFFETLESRIVAGRV